MNEKYLLDTNIVSDLFNKESIEYQKLQLKLISLGSDVEIYISILTLYELEYGYENAPDDLKDKIRTKINKIENSFSILPLSKPGVSYFGKLKKALKDLTGLKKENLRKYNSNCSTPFKKPIVIRQ
jgi:predicted nucleic acid-binding protein